MAWGILKFRVDLSSTMGVPYHSMEKTARLFIRLSEERKQEWMMAAKIRGLSLSAWVTTVCVEQARKVLRENE